jgi:hypothetical protein
MRIRHPISFFVLIVAIVITATLTVAFNVIHIMGLFVAIGALIGLREVAFREGRHVGRKERIT